MDQPDPKHPQHPGTFGPTDVAPPIASGPDLVAYLFANGHFHQRDANNFATQLAQWSDVRDLPTFHPRVCRAILSWQSMRPDLQPTGTFDQPSLNRATAESRYRCGLPDVIPRTALLAAWPTACKHDITTAHDLAALPYVSQTGQSINDAWLRGLEPWNSNADLTLKCCPGQAQPRITARTQLLGRYVLAWSELANGNCNSQLQQAYNLQINWRWHLLWTTICHEIGHAIGIGHGGRGIMQPAHDPSVTDLDDWDQKQLVERYGSPAPEPPEPGPGPQPWHHALITLYDSDGRETAAYELNPRSIQ